MHNFVPMSFCLFASLCLEIIPRLGLPGSKGKCICNFARCCQIVLRKDYIILPSQLQCMKAPSVQFSHSVMSDSVTPWTAAHQASLSITSSWSLLKLMSIKSVMPSNHLILCCPLLLLPSIFPSIRVFSNKAVLCIK